MTEAIKSPGFIIGVVLIVAGAFLGPAGTNLIIAGAGLVLGALLAPKPDEDVLDEIRGRTVTSRDPISPWMVIYGEPRVAGVITYMTLSGRNNEFLNLIITLAGHEVDAIGDMYFNDELVPLSGVDATGKFVGHARIEKFLGASNQAAAAFLRDETRPIWRSAGFQGGIRFNGSGHFVSTPDNTNCRPAVITIETWFRGRLGATGTILSHNAGTNWKLEWLTDNTIKFTDSAGTEVTATTALAIDKWHHVAVIGDSSGISITIRDVLITVSSGSTGTAYSGGSTSGPLRMASLDGETSYFTGELDNVRVWDDIRTAQEIVGNINLELDGSQANLVSNWNMTEGSGNTAADNAGGGNDGTLQPMWTDNHRQRGRAYVYVRLKWNVDLFSNGMPNITFLIRGKKVLDPRTDQTITVTPATDRVNATAHGLVANDQVEFSTTGTLPGGLLLDTLYHVINETPNDFQVAIEPGGTVVDITDAGTGVHTATERAWADNPSLCIADYFHDEPYGLKAPFTEIDNTLLTAAANNCEEQVSRSSAPDEDRYDCDGAFLVSKTPQSILEEMLSSMGGQLTYISGLWGLFAAVFRTPTITLDEKDMTGSIRIRPLVSRRTNFNAVRGVFVSPDNNWQPSDFPPITNALYEEEDGERVYRELALPYTKSQTMAQRLAKILLERTRQGLSMTVPAKLTAFELQPPNTVQISNVRMGFTQKEFEIVGGQLTSGPGSGRAPVLGYLLSLRETAAAVFDWIQVAVTATVATDRLNATAHGLVNGNAVQFTTDGTLPGGLSLKTTYWVINATANDFQVEAISGSGTPVDITDTGTGTHTATMEAAQDLAPNTGLPNPFLIFPPDNVVLASGTSQLDIRLDGTIFSRIKASWDAIEDEFVTAGGQIDVEYKKSADANYQPSGLVSGSETFAFILDVQDGVAYDVRIRAVNSLGTRSTFVEVLSHTVIGKTAPPNDVQNFTAQQNGLLVTFIWDQVPDLDLSGYEIRFGVVGIAWEDASPLTETVKGTRVTDATVAPSPKLSGGTRAPWQFYVKAIDTSDNESVNTAGFQLIVKPDFDAIISASEFPLWSGLRTNLVRDPKTGFLNPEDQNDASADDQALFDTYVVNPFASIGYEAQEIDTLFDDDSRVWADIDSNLGPGETGLADPKLQIDHRLAADSFDGFENWTIGNVTARFYKFKFDQLVSVGLIRITDFRPTVDLLEHSETVAITIPVGGLKVVFQKTYRENPQVTVDDFTPATVPVFFGVNLKGFSVWLLDTGGVDVGGSADYTAKGI